MRSAFFATLSALAMVPVASVADPIDFGKNHVVGIVAGGEISKKQKTSYRKFKSKGGYFGAMFTNDKTDKSYWVWGFHDLKIARATAKADCELRSKGEGSCRLLAVSYPKGQSAGDDFSGGLSSGARAAFLGQYLKSQVAESYGAFAISDSGDYGFSWGYDNKAEAQAAAIAECKAGVAVAMTEISEIQRDWSRKNGLIECRLVDTRIGR